MSSIIGMTIVSVIIIIIVLVLTVVQVNKAYQYKHKVDPHPVNDDHEDNGNKQ